MANQDAPFGFRQVGGLGSRQTSEGTSKYVIQSTQAGAIYAGDVVTAGNGTTKYEVVEPSHMVILDHPKQTQRVMSEYSMEFSTTIQQLLNQRLKTTGPEESQ